MRAGAETRLLCGCSEAQARLVRPAPHPGPQTQLRGGQVPESSSGLVSASPPPPHPCGLNETPPSHGPEWMKRHFLLPETRQGHSLAPSHLVLLLTNPQVRLRKRLHSQPSVTLVVSLQLLRFFCSSVRLSSRSPTLASAFPCLLLTSRRQTDTWFKARTFAGKETGWMWRKSARCLSKSNSNPLSSDHLTCTRWRAGGSLGSCSPGCCAGKWDTADVPPVK